MSSNKLPEFLTDQSLRFESSLLFFAQNSEAVVDALGSDLQGLSPKEAEFRLKKYGHNELREAQRISLLSIFHCQFKSLVMIILIIATLVSWLLGEWLEAAVIMIIMVLIALFGFLQEFKAEQAMRALRQLATPRAVVLRKGKRVEIDARNLVPGDVLVLESGNIVPADARLLHTVNLYIEEAALTGESESVKKQADRVALNVVLAERANMVFSGTSVTQGRGKAVVTATEMSTEISKIAVLLQEAPQESTPLQIKLNQLGNSLSEPFLHGVPESSRLSPNFHFHYAGYVGDVRCSQQQVDFHSLWRMGAFNNHWLWLAVFSFLLIQVMVVLQREPMNFSIRYLYRLRID